MFILATTELNKLPATIVSRCQRFDFRRLSSDNIVGHLGKISKSEGIDLTDAGARIIARMSLGGMRDAISLLELCAGTNETVNEELVTRVLGVGGGELPGQIVDAASLTGTPVRVKAAVKLWKDQVDLQLRRGEDLQRAVRPAQKRRAPVPVATAAAEKLGSWVTVVGALSEPADLDGKGTSYRLTDDSGSIQVVFWNSTVPPDLQKRAAAAARASVNGKVREYQGTRQVVPSKADGVEIAE